MLSTYLRYFAIISHLKYGVALYFKELSFPSLKDGSFAPSFGQIDF